MRDESAEHKLKQAAGWLSIKFEVLCVLPPKIIVVCASFRPHNVTAFYLVSKALKSRTYHIIQTTSIMSFVKVACEYQLLTSLTISMAAISRSRISWQARRLAATSSVSLRRSSNRDSLRNNKQDREEREDREGER
jgi:hypothetical protein